MEQKKYITYLKFLTIGCLLKNCYSADKSHFAVPEWHLFSLLYCSKVNVTLRPTVPSPHKHKAQAPCAAKHCHLLKCLAWLISVKSEFHIFIEHVSEIRCPNMRALWYHISYEIGNLAHLILGACLAVRVLDSDVPLELVVISSLWFLGGAWGGINLILKQIPTLGHLKSSPNSAPQTLLSVLAVSPLAAMTAQPQLLMRRLPAGLPRSGWASRARVFPRVRSQASSRHLQI